MTDIKTGNKGFINPADDGKVYVMDPVPPGDPGGNESPPDYDPGNMTVDNSVRDISKKTRITLGTYLSKVTKGEAGAATKPNAYPIDPSTDASLPSSITTQGFPTPLGVSDNSAQFKQILPSSFSPDFPAVKNDFKKGKGPAVVPDGNSLLPTATPDAQSTQLTPGGPVQKYTTLVADGNRWELDGPTFSGGEDISQPSKSFNVPLQSVAVAGMPSAEVSSQAQYNLDLEALLKPPAELTTENSIPVPGPFDTNSLSATTTNGVPTPLAPTTSGFAPNLPSYVSNDYASSGQGGIGGLQKGRTSIEGPDGNQFIAKVELDGGEIKSPEKLAEYTAAAVVPNRFVANASGIGFSSSSELDNPPADFDVPLQGLATAVMPNQEATDPANAKYDFTLQDRVTRPAVETLGNTYPVTQPSLQPPYSIRTSLGFPAPLTPPVNQNSDSNGPQVHDPNLQSTPTPAGIKKGKTSDASFLDGHTLLSDSIVEQNGNVSLPVAIQPYTTQKLNDNNEFVPTGPMVPPEIDPTTPPDFYQVRLLDIDEKGKFVDADKQAILLDDLRKIPAEITQKNSYPIEDKYPSLSPTTDKVTGNPVPFAQTAQSNFDSFYVPRDLIKPSSTDPSIQNLSKGKSQVDADYDGNNLLLPLKGNKSVSNPEDKYLVEGPGLNYEGSRGGFLGNFDPKDTPVYTYKGGAGSVLNNSRFAQLSAVGPTFNPTYTLSTGQKVNAMQLAQIGAGLSQRASAEIPGFSSNLSAGAGGGFDPNSAGAELGAILPSVSQLGILKVDDLLLSAKDTFDSIDGEFPSDSLTDIAPFGGQSWGNLTNVSEPYDDAFSLGLFITTLLMILAIKLLFILISLIASDENHVKTDAAGQLTLGRYKWKDESSAFGFSLFPSWFEIFGITPTQNPFSRALEVGTNSYFVGAENADAGFGDFLAASIGLGDLFEDDRRMYTALITCRTIVRSAFLLAVALERIAKSPNVAVGIKAFLNIMRIIRASKFITAINVFSMLGDQVLTSNQNVALVIGPDGKSKSEQIVMGGSADDYIHSSVRKSRIGSNNRYDPTLSWSSQRSPSLYLLNSKLGYVQGGDHENNLGSFKGIRALDFSKSKATGNRRAKVYGLEGPRISSEDRIKIENQLEAEYVPFYFHDVRTNEVISFHAFLASLSDDFTSSYDSVEGFGRVEPVKIYKGTQRKIGMSFHVASTSPADFDHMWHKLNKLTTMVYPQYTRGKTMVGQNYNFVAPFSQLVGASPLIRIRLGDLIRGNYSRFSLARLFGLTDGDASVIDADGNKKEIELDPPDIKQKQKDLSARLKELEEGDEVEITGPGFVHYGSSIDSAARKMLDAIIKDIVTRRETNSRDPNSLDTEEDLADAIDAQQSTRKNLSIKRKYIVTKVVEETEGDERVHLRCEFTDPNTIKNLRELAGDPYAFFSSDVELRISRKYVRLTSESRKKLEKEILNYDNSLIENFIDPQNNSITKSFESAGGKGLAGFIESMQFDWYSGTTWEIEPGSTAPKMCKVTISFSPIHDITPGIDHTGYNRAPIYPVGDAMRSAAIKPPTKQ